jgi:hypothetical protein
VSKANRLLLVDPADGSVTAKKAWSSWLLDVQVVEHGGTTYVACTDLEDRMTLLKATGLEVLLQKRLPAPLSGQVLLADPIPLRWAAASAEGAELGGGTDVARGAVLVVGPLMRCLRLLLLVFLLAVLPAFFCGPVFSSQVHAMELGDDGDDDGGLMAGDDDDEGLSLEEGGDGKIGTDLELLKGSHLSYLHSWVNARPLRRPRGGYPQKTYHWAPVRDGGYGPLGTKPIHTYVEVPETGTYRLYLRHVITAKAKRPVTLTLTPQKATPLAPDAAGVKKADPPAGFSFADNGPALSHVYGDLTFLSAVTGKKMEKKLPLRFESEPELIGYHDQPSMVWEFWDVELARGAYRVALESDLKSVSVSHLLLSRSKDFRPSLTTYGVRPNSTPYGKDRTLERVWLRFRVKEGTVDGATYSIDSRLTYHWRGRSFKGSTEPMWGYRMGKVPDAPAEGWSAWLDGTDALVLGPGPWSTCRLGFSGIQKGRMEIQLAWHPHEGAVQHTTTVKLDQARAMLRLPHKTPWVPTSATAAVWGMWPERYVQGVQPEAQVIERYFDWTKEAEAALALAPDHPRPHHIKIFTGCGLGPANYDRGCEMLARLGVNWIPSASPARVTSPALRKKYNLYHGFVGYNHADAEGAARKYQGPDRKHYLKHKIGDEIHTHSSAASVNGNPVSRRAFHAYLREQARLNGLDNAAFLGVASFDRIDSIDVLPEHPGRYERRLFYASQRYAHINKIDYYRGVTERFHKYFPNVRVYNNYSPHPVFLTGTTMNSVDWFILCRNRAQMLGWGEDWAYAGSWSLGTYYQCTSFFAAIVEASTRKHGYESGFYVGVNCGGGARKIFSCVGQGLSWLELYAWGPIDALAEGSNAWSERKDQYKAVLTATAALGPADTIIGKGQREPRRTAILYNRSHEIWQGGTGRMNHDWMWTYIALRGAQVPVDVIIEEDLTPEELAQYRVVYLGGFNLAARHVKALRGWVEAGGLLIGTAGAAKYDVFNDKQPATDALFGARQTMIPQPPRKRGEKAPPPPVVTFSACELAPAGTLPAPGLQFALEPAAAKVIGTYEGGRPAATLHPVGKGHAMLLGFQPGFAYRAGEKWAEQPTGKVHALLMAPARTALGRPVAEYSDTHFSETAVFTHASGMAVMLASFLRQPPGATTLSVKPDRKVTSVVSALKGKLEWTEKEGRIEIAVPKLDPVDVIILK